MNLMVDRTPDVHETGEALGELETVGSLNCVECGYALSLEAVDEVPHCPACDGTRFRRGRLFERPTMEATFEPADSAPAWLSDVRRGISSPGLHLAFQPDDEPVVVALGEGWTRIGRSGAADVRLDDPTVSRRHALIVRTDEAELHAMDDRSLNGLFVNGERVEWAQLHDGDELEIGCFRFYVVDSS